MPSGELIVPSGVISQALGKAKPSSEFGPKFQRLPPPPCKAMSAGAGPGGTPPSGSVNITTVPTPFIDWLPITG